VQSHVWLATLANFFSVTRYCVVLLDQRDSLQPLSLWLHVNVARSFTVYHKLINSHSACSCNWFSRYCL